MSEWITRAQIGLRPARGSTALVASRVEGWAWHWPGSAKPINAVGDAGFRRVCSALRGWQDYHMDGHGWSDIAYMWAVDQVGRKYTLRGLNIQSAANGDQDVNRRFGAGLLILGPGETPTPAMMRTALETGAEFCARYRGARKKPYGHQDVRPRNSSGDKTTDCPGPIAEALINAGRFTVGASVPSTPTVPTDEENVMAGLTQADVPFLTQAFSAALKGDNTDDQAFDKTLLVGDHRYEGQQATWLASAIGWSVVRHQELHQQGVAAGDALSQVKDELWGPLSPLWAQS